MCLKNVMDEGLSSINEILCYFTKTTYHIYRQFQINIENNQKLNLCKKFNNVTIAREYASYFKAGFFDMKPVIKIIERSQILI